MVQIVWSKNALSDLKGIKEFISQDSLKYAQIQITRIVDRIDILKTMPLRGKVCHEVQRPEIRELIEGNYRIIYKIENPKQVKILVVHHGARDLKQRKIR